jgi:hypothetical protein
MARYINPEKIKLDSLTWLDGDSDILVPLVDVKKAIAQTPTEDVVAVVRCKDCIYRQALSPAYDYKGRHCMTCLNWHRPTKEDGYCNEGIRKETL